jgi:hypothetical protein
LIKGAPFAKTHIMSFLSLPVSERERQLPQFYSKIIEAQRGDFFLKFAQLMEFWEQNLNPR